MLITISKRARRCSGLLLASASACPHRQAVSTLLLATQAARATRPHLDSSSSSRTSSLSSSGRKFPAHISSSMSSSANRADSMSSSAQVGGREITGGGEEVDLRAWEQEYADLKINWFPGHMVKATNSIREKLKHVDMVFEVRDARVPFSSANADLDKLVGPSKARLVILNKSDLANPRVQQAVLKRFQDEGKTALFACGKTGTNIGKVLAWAKKQGARRGEFATTGTVAMVVGMPNVGKSSLINLLRGKATRQPGGGGEGAKQVARVGATPGVTRQVSAVCIATTPPLYLVDTPGVMVPRVTSATVGLRLALIRAVPEAAVPPDILAAFMLRLVRARRPLRRSALRRRLADTSNDSDDARDSNADHTVASIRPPRHEDPDYGAIPSRTEEHSYCIGYDDSPRDAEGSGGKPGDAATPGLRSIEAWVRSGGVMMPARPHVRGTAEVGAAAGHAFARKQREMDQTASAREEDNVGYYARERDLWEYDMDKLLLDVERESGAQGKVEPNAKRRICCRYLLDAFWNGKFGRLTLDSIVGNNNNDSTTDKLASSTDYRSSNENGTAGDYSGWTSRESEALASKMRGNKSTSKNRGVVGGDDAYAGRAGEWLPARLDRDWSNPSAWDVSRDTKGSAHS